MSTKALGFGLVPHLFVLRRDLRAGEHGPHAAAHGRHLGGTSSTGAPDLSGTSRKERTAGVWYSTAVLRISRRYSARPQQQRRAARRVERSAAASDTGEGWSRGREAQGRGGEGAFGVTLQLLLALLDELLRQRTRQPARAPRVVSERRPRKPLGARWRGAGGFALLRRDVGQHDRLAGNFHLAQLRARTQKCRQLGPNVCTRAQRHLLVQLEKVIVALVDNPGDGGRAPHFDFVDLSRPSGTTTRRRHRADTTPATASEAPTAAPATSVKAIAGTHVCHEPHGAHRVGLLVFDAHGVRVGELHLQHATRRGHGPSKRAGHASTRAGRPAKFGAQER
jgi:hypothetical protein